MNWLHKLSQRELFDLRQHGKLILRAPHDECLEKLHDIYPGSWHSALQHEGYTISPIGEDWKNYYNKQTEKTEDSEKELEFFDPRKREPDFWNGPNNFYRNENKEESSSEEKSWVCHECYYETGWSEDDLIERGMPICPNCDIEMKPDYQ